MIGYRLPGFPLTEYGSDSRLIFSGIFLLSLAITFSFYIRHLNENRLLKDQLLQLKRQNAVLLERYLNPAADSRDEFMQIYVDYNLQRLGLSSLENSILRYRDDNSMHNLHDVIEQMKLLEELK